MQELTLQSEYITLGQLLKVVGAVDSGGEARGYLEETPALVNGEPEQRRGRKLRPGDVVKIEGMGTWQLASRKE